MNSQDYNTFKSSPPNTSAWNETDSNADTCCLGKNFTVIKYTERTADVYPYNTSYQPLQNVPIVTGATAWDDPVDGKTWILVINEGLYYGNQLDHSLINPNQLRSNGIIYQDNPFSNENVNTLHTTRDSHPDSMTSSKTQTQSSIAT